MGGSPTLQAGTVMNYLQEKKEFMVLVNSQGKASEKKPVEEVTLQSGKGKGNKQKINFSFSKNKKTDPKPSEEIS
jgi:predicted transcriptional regulator